MKRIGIIGCGKIAQLRHIPEYAARGDVRLTAFFDANTERAQELAGRYGGKAYESCEALLASGEVDAVSVCTPNEMHAETAMAAMKAGLDVLCEKPMAVTPQQCRKMVETARETGRILMIGQNQRLARGHAIAKRLLEQGEIGKVLSFRTVFGHGGPETWSIDPGRDTWFFDRKKAVMGAMADLGIHKTDLIRFLLGERITEVTAFMGTLDKKGSDGSLIGVDDNAVCIYRMESGCVGTMTASWTYYGSEDNSTVLYGTNGIMSIYADPDYCVVVTKPDGSRILYEADRIQTNDNQTSSGVIDAFVDAINGDDSLLISGESVLEAMRAVFAAEESARTGRTVKVEQG